MPTERLKERILAFARALPEGTPIAAKGLLHMGDRAAINQVLSRLAKQGVLLRTARGVYLLPVESRFGKHSPSIEKTLSAWAEYSGERITLSGGMAANALGFTTQVPVRRIYLTSGRSRHLKFGKLVVELRHAPNWQLALGNTKAGDAIRALFWLGPEWAEIKAKQARSLLNSEERSELSRVAEHMPSWLSDTVSQIAHG